MIGWKTTINLMCELRTVLMMKYTTLTLLSISIPATHQIVSIVLLEPLTLRNVMLVTRGTMLMTQASAPLTLLCGFPWSTM